VNSISGDVTIPLLPPEYQVFSDPLDRDRLSPVVLTLYRAIADAWDLSEAEASALIAISERVWRRVRRGMRKDLILSPDQLTRASTLIGIHDLLRRTRSMTEANSWPKTRNEHVVFAGSSPIDAMLKGGVPAMYSALRLVGTRQFSKIG
jgi:hypothetical protein